MFQNSLWNTKIAHDCKSQEQIQNSPLSDTVWVVSNQHARAIDQCENHVCFCSLARVGIGGAMMRRPGGTDAVTILLEQMIKWLH